MANLSISIFDNFLSGGNVGNNLRREANAALNASTLILSLVAWAVRYFKVALLLRLLSSRESPAHGELALDKYASSEDKEQGSKTLSLKAKFVNLLKTITLPLYSKQNFDFHIIKEIFIIYIADINLTSFGVTRKPQIVDCLNMVLRIIKFSFKTFFSCK